MNQLQIERIKNVIVNFDYYNMLDEYANEQELLDQIELASESDVIDYLLDLIEEF